MPKFPEYMDAELRNSYVRDGYIHDIYDGDTVYYHAALGYGLWAAFQTGRLLDCYAVEVRPLATRSDGLAAKAYLLELIHKYALNRHDPKSVEAIGHHLKIRSVKAPNKWFGGLPKEKTGKYGRWLVVLLGADDNGHVVNLNELMVQSGYAKSCP